MIARAVAFVKNVDTSYWNFGTCLGQVGRNTADKLQIFRFECFLQTAVEFNVVFVGNENGQVRKLGYLFSRNTTCPSLPFVVGTDL